MSTIREYLHFNGKARGYDFSDSFREVMIFQMINSFEQDKTPEDAVNADGYQAESNLTLAQKRRIRRSIVKKANAYVKDHPEASINDPEVIENAFFETDFGKQYAYLRSDWQTNERQDMINLVSDWTIGQEPADNNAPPQTLRIVISPYDPMFDRSDFFDEKNDQLAYIIGWDRTKSQSGVKNADIYDIKGYSEARKTGLNKSFFLRKNPDGTMDLDIVAAHAGSGHLLEPYNDETIRKYRDSSTLKALEGDVTRSGYNHIKRYIKTNIGKMEVRDFLLEQTSDDKLPLSVDELHFMEETCKWLSDSGIDFDIEVSEMDDKKYLVARLGNHRDIRLLDRTDPFYQGRIYDEGSIAYMSVPTNGDKNNAAIQQKVTWQDRLNGIKWYFGEEVNMSDAYGKHIGEARVKRAPIVNSRNNTIASVYKTDDATMVAVAYKTHDERTLPISMKIKPITFSFRRVVPAVFSGAYNQSAAVSNLNKNLDYIPEDSIYPEDKANVEVDVLDEYGEATGETEMRTGISDDFDISRMSYYKHVYVREKLDSWVDSAKETHRQGVNIDELVATYDRSVEMDDSDIVPAFDDENFEEIRRLYWDVLTGVKETGNISNNEDETSEQNDTEIAIDAFNDDIYSASREEKIRMIHEHYEKYLDKAFGRVPELHKPFLSDEENEEIDKRNKTAGFNPSMVAKFMKSNETTNSQNMKYIQHMLSQLDDEYNHDYLKDGVYMSDELRKSMIKYDSKTAACQIYNEERGRNVGLAESVLFDEQGNPDYESIYEKAPSLRNKPVTTEMLLHTFRSLEQSGVLRESIEVNVDDNGIISYRGVQNTDLSGQAIKEYSLKKEYSKTYFKNPGEKNKKPVLISGEIGQIFEPDEYGCIIPNYGGMGESSKVIVPGYNAYLTMGDSIDSSSARDRLRLFDWQHMMKQAITSEIRRASLSNPAQYGFLPSTTSLNNVYKHSYDMKMSVKKYRDKLDPESDIYKKMEPIKDSKGNYVYDDNGNMSMELVPRNRDEVLKEIDTFKAVIKTLRGRCRFPNEYTEGATTRAQSMLEHPTTEAAMNFDYYWSDLNDNRNFRVLDEEFDGIFDITLTATAKNAGTVRYVLPGVKVDSTTGKPKPVEYDWHDHSIAAPLMNDELLKYAAHDSHDRIIMASTNIITAPHTPRGVGVAFMNINGDTYEDAVVVSKAFANKYIVEGADGNLRPLIPQDKILDSHGNKGVIARVVDPTQHSSHMIKEISGWDISDPDHSTVEYRGKTYNFKYDMFKKHEDGSECTLGEQAVKAIQKELYIDDDICKLFDKNPQLDVVMSPYSGLSRHNGGTLREGMAKPDKLWKDGEYIQGGMCHMNMIVTDMLADVKTHFYDEDMVREGKGRKASSQLLWALEAKRSSELIREMYGYNDKAWDNLREYMIVTGLDINEKLEPQVGYTPQVKRGEHRKLMMLPDDDVISNIKVSERTGKINKPSMRSTNIDIDIVSVMDKSGGFMEVPFELNFNSAKYTKRRIPGMDNVDFTTQKSGNVRKIGNDEVETYGVPVLPPNLRAGQVFVDGTMQSHDYTNWYTDIHKSSVEYIVYKTQADELDNKIKNGEFSGETLNTEKKRLELLNDNMEKSKAKAQHSFDKIVSDVVNRQFNTKHNVFRDQCMAARLPSSATAVVSPDAKLKSDQIAMSHESAMSLGIMSYDSEKKEYYWTNRTFKKDGSVKSPGSGRVLIFRDPILRDGAMRCMDVVIDDSIKGMKMNPAVCKSFDGDYDGDAYGVYAPHSPAAQMEAYTKFHVSNNMLDLGEKNSVTGKYPLYIGSGLDMASNAYADPSGKIQKMREDLEEKANKLQLYLDDVAEGKCKIDDFEFEARVAATEMRGNRRVMTRDEQGDIVYDTNEDGSYKTQILRGKDAVTACKLECKRDLDDYLKAAFDGIGTAHVIMESPETVVESLQKIVDSGAKGDAGKMKGLCDSIGLEYEVDENNKAIANTTKNITHEVNGKAVPCPRIIKESDLADRDLARERNMVIQRATAYKADDTAVGGMISQHMVSAIRNATLGNDSYEQNDRSVKDLEQSNFVLGASLDLTSRFTQSILDSKQDVDKAIIKDEIFNFWGDDVLAGYKLSGNWKSDDPKVIQKQTHKRIMKTAVDPDGHPIPAQEKGADGKYYPKYDESGQPVYEKYYEKCTKEEWIQQMKGFLLAADVKYNEKTLHKFAEVFTSDKPRPLTRPDGSVIQYYDVNEKKRKPLMTSSPRIDGMYTHAETDGALFDKLAYDGRYTSLVEASLRNSAAYRINTNNPLISPAGSIMGNAVDKGVEVYDCMQQRKGLSRNDPKSKELAADMSKLKFETDASGMPLPKYIAKAIYDDEHGGSSRPIGCRQSLSKDERDRYMGETTEAYNQRIMSLESTVPQSSKTDEAQQHIDIMQKDTAAVIQSEKPVMTMSGSSEYREVPYVESDSNDRQHDSRGESPKN